MWLCSGVSGCVVDADVGKDMGVRDVLAGRWRREWMHVGETGGDIGGV